MAYAVLQVHSSESRFKMGSFSSRTSMLYVLDCLYGILFSLDYDKNMDNLVKFARRKVERSYFYSGLGRGDSTD
jgi:DNA-binding MurR/RpiR family transcriptional regulator